MHTARQIKASSFDVTIDGKESDLDGVFPDWNRADRFGIVVDQPLGSVGANLMIQAAISQYYDARRDTHRAVPTYPEIYVFHVGGPHGEHGMYDVTPKRKEVFVSPEVWRLIVAIAERGITRLAVPDRAPSDFDYIDHAGGWFYGTALLDHLTSVYAYSPETIVDGADVVISSDDDDLFTNRHATLDLDIQQAIYASITEENSHEMDLGYTTFEDTLAYVNSLKKRIDEVTPETRALLTKKYEHIRSEQYRRITPEEGLKLLKSSCESVTGEFSGVSPVFAFAEELN